jgi:hypothetical protein
LKAQQALKRLTGCTFPSDVEASLRAWQQAKDMFGDEAVTEGLPFLLDYEADPLVARLANDKGGLVVMLTNLSSKPVTLAKHPSMIDIDTGQASMSRGFDEVAGTESFLTVPPGGSAEVDLGRAFGPGEEQSSGSSYSSYFGHSGTGGVLSELLASGPQSRKVALHYTRNGNEFGVNGWIGTLLAQPGPHWTEPSRKTELVETRWPNGKVKERGYLVNGLKHGAWTYYREDGGLARKVWYIFDASSKTYEGWPATEGEGTERSGGQTEQKEEENGK